MDDAECPVETAIHPSAFFGRRQLGVHVGADVFHAGRFGAPEGEREKFFVFDEYGLCAAVVDNFDQLNAQGVQLAFEQFFLGFVVVVHLVDECCQFFLPLAVNKPIYGVQEGLLGFAFVQRRRGKPDVSQLRKAGHQP